MAAELKETVVLGSSSMSQSVILGDGAHNRTPNCKIVQIRSRFKERKDCPYQHECYQVEPGVFYVCTKEMLEWLRKDSDSPFFRHPDALEVFDIQPPKCEAVKPYIPGEKKNAAIAEGYPVAEWDADRLRTAAMRLKGFPLNDGFRMASLEAKADMLRKFMKGHDIKPSALEDTE
jgi:hypothetical protein